MALKLSTGLRNKLLGLSTNLITNGEFTSAATSWTATDATLLSAASGQDGNCLEIAETGDANPGQAYQDFTTKIGRLYKLTYYFKKGTADSGRVDVGTTGDPDALIVGVAHSDASFTKYTKYFEATSTTTRVTLESTDATSGETSLFDTVAVESVLDGFKAIMTDAKMNIYTGSQPADADSASTGTLLVTISDTAGSDGFQWNDAAAGSIGKLTAQTWSGTAVAGGTAGWFRVFEEDDTPADATTTGARFDGAIAVSGAELNISNTSVESSSTQTISSGSFTLPAS
jgi:hypothetical protein